MMDAQRIEVRAQSAPWWNGIEILVGCKEGERWLVGYDVVFEESDATKLSGPTLKLSHDKAQVLMDDLWACGIRPTEGSGSAGALRATESHLKDMRQIVFQFLGKITIT